MKENELKTIREWKEVNRHVFYNERSHPIAYDSKRPLYSKLQTGKLKPKPKPRSSKMILSYAQRDANLWRLGYDDYQSYLRSNLWRDIRREVLEMNNYKCKLCGYGANQVHHTSYSMFTLTGRKLSTLVPLCRKCHKSIEFSNNYYKVDFFHIYTISDAKIMKIKDKIVAQNLLKLKHIITGKQCQASSDPNNEQSKTLGS